MYKKVQFDQVSFFKYEQSNPLLGESKNCLPTLVSFMTEFNKRNQIHSLLTQEISLRINFLLKSLTIFLPPYLYLVLIKDYEE